MENTNFPMLYSLIFCIIAFAITIIIFLKKVKKGWLWLLIIAVVIAGGNYLRYRVIHKDFFTFRAEIRRDYPEVKTIKMNHVGGTCYVDVYVKPYISDLEQIEPIFIDIIKNVNQEPMSTYLKKYPSPTEDDNIGRWIHLSISFYKKEFGRNTALFGFRSRDNSMNWFTESNKKNQIWKESKTSKEYRYWDYVQQ